MENGQADNGPDDLSGLADFLAEQPETDSIEEDEAETDEAPEEDNADSEEDDQPEDSDDEESKEEAPEETPATDRKIVVKVKDDNGQETQLEVSEAELVASYHRQADYTRKTQALADRENQAVEILKSKHDEIRNHYLNEAQTLRVALAQVAGIKSDSEMAELASTDPAGWVAERQRQEAIQQYLASLDSRMTQEQQRAAAEAQEMQARQLKQWAERSWVELSKQGIDRDKLLNIYQDSAKAYGFDMAEFSNVYDHRQVLVLKDAMAYRALKNKAPEVTKKAKDAPRMPSKQTQPANERRSQQLDAKFKGGRAKLSDLAALLR